MTTQTGTDAHRFSCPDEHQEFRSYLRAFLSKKSSSETVRGLLDDASGFDADTWARMANDIGIVGLGIPEMYGGSGSGLVERAIVMEEIGRSLLGAPYLSTAVLAVDSLVFVADERARAEFLPRIATGDMRIAVALGDAFDLGHEQDSIDVRQDGPEFRLTGSHGFVLDARSADAVLVVAPGESGLGLFMVPVGEGVTIAPTRTVDLTRRMAKVEFGGALARRIATVDAEGLSAVADRAQMALAAEQLGVAQKALDLSVEYARERTQFGRVIGSFQALKHLCADMAVEVELARSLAYGVAGGSEEERHLYSPLVASYCSEVAMNVTREAIQIHGGIGFTWEHDIHLYYRRAALSSQLFGDPARCREAYARRARFVLDGEAVASRAGAGDRRVGKERSR